MAEEEPETITCHRCEEVVDFDDSMAAETIRGKWDDVCRHCYDHIVKTCQLCGDEDVMPSDVSRFILVKAELSASARRPPGIYRIRDYPFLMIPVIGSASLCAHDVLFIDKLPEPDDEYEISGNICRKCSVPFMGAMLKNYTRRLPSPYSEEGWAVEKAHTRRVILDNPDMLRDLECDATASRWQDMKRMYDLPDLPTFHEWLFVEHQGVKVFRVYQGDSGWLALRPEPEYRNSHKYTPLIFAASGLPTYQSNEEYDYDHSDKCSRPAVLAAIEAGLLTQDGVLKDGAIVHCG